MIDTPRVLMIGWELPPHNSGGLGVACANLSQALLANKLSIDFTLPYHYDGEFNNLRLIDCHPQSNHFSRSQNPPFHAYNSPSPKKHQLNFFNPPTSLMEIQVNEYAQKVLEFARAHADSFDLVHAHDWMGLPAAIKIKQELGKPFIAHIHSTEYDRSLSENSDSFITRCEVQGMRLADRVIAVSYYTKRLLVEKYHVNTEKIEVVHNGVLAVLQDLNEIKRTFAYRRPVVVFMGRLTMQKGPDYFLELAGKVIEKLPDTLFIISGMGDMYQQLLFTNAGKSLSANVLFSGFVRGGAQAAILKRADVFVMPSVSEPFGLVATEAAVLGTPVIASKNSGVVEIMTDSPKFDFWDTQTMADEVIHLLQDQTYRSQVVKAQVAKLSKATWNKAAKKVERIYRQVVRKKKR